MPTPSNGDDGLVRVRLGDLVPEYHNADESGGNRGDGTGESLPG